MSETRFHGDSARPFDYFTGCAGAYLRSRPRYPDEALRAILDGLPPGARVAEVGCGPAIAGRRLAELGARVVGVEPNGDMLRAAYAAPPPAAGRLCFVRGCAEATGLRDACVDAVVCAQSFHWCDPARALPEFQRILRPGGRLALLWSFRVPDDGPRARYRRVMQAARDAADAAGRTAPRAGPYDLTVGSHFEAARTRRVDHATAYDQRRLLERASSTSFFPESGPLRDRLMDELRALFEDHQQDGRVVLETVCEVTLADRASV